MFGVKSGVDNVAKSLCLSGGIEGVMQGVIILSTLEGGTYSQVSLGSLLEVDEGNLGELDMPKRVMEGDLVGPGVSDWRRW